MAVAEAIADNLVQGTQTILLSTADVEAGGPPFAMTYTFAEITDTAGTYFDHTMQLGWNMAAGGGRIISAEPAWGIQWESKFRQNGSSPLGCEWHVRMQDTGGTEHRPISVFWNRDGSGGGISFENNYYNFNRIGGVPRVQFDFTSSSAGAIYLSGPTRIAASYNGSAVIQQQNAAGNAFLPLPYFNSNDELQIAGPIALSGMAKAPNNALIAASATLTANQSVFNFAVSGSVTGSLFGYVLQGACTEEFAGLIQQNHGSSPNAHAVSVHRVLNGNVGDAFSRYEVNGVTFWSVGLDNSDGDKFKVSKNSTLGTNDRVVIDDNTVSFGLPARLPNYTVAQLPSASAAGAGAIVYVTNASGGPVIACSDGTNWRVVAALGAVVS